MREHAHHSTHTTAACVERPILLITTQAGRQLVERLCPICAQAGVRPGMTLAHARALMPWRGPNTSSGREDELIVSPHEPDRDARALHALALWANRFSPMVAIDPPDGLLIDVAGCERLYQRPRRLVQSLADAVAKLDIRARCAIAPTFGCAWAMARCGEQPLAIIPPDSLRQSLAPLPVAALRIDDSIVESLHDIGIDQIGHLFDLPRAALPSRFGHELLLRLDQALGQAIEAMTPVRPTESPAAERAFAGPTKQLEAIQITARALVEQLADQLTTMERGARVIVLHMERSDASPIDIRIPFSRACRNARHMTTLLAPHIESANLGFGVERLVLTAVKTARLQHTQYAHWRTEGAHRDTNKKELGELLDTFASRLGEDRINRLQPAPTHIPERAYEAKAARNDRSKTPREDLGSTVDADRPSILFAKPEPIHVLSIAPEGPPSWLRWRGEERTVFLALGPERICGEWWVEEATERRSDGATKGRKEHAVQRCVSGRDYYKVQDDRGRWLWLFREVDDARWFVQGEWG